MKNLKTITFDGINRSAGRFTDKGICEEVINLGKRRSPLLEVIPRKEVQDVYPVDLDLYDILYRYATLPVNEMIGCMESTGEVYRITPGEATVILTVDAPGNEDFYQVSHLGNIIILHTSVKAYYLKYDPDADTFTKLGDIPVLQSLITQYGSAKTITCDMETTFEDAKADLIARDADARKDGWLEGNVLGILAWRLYDNSYIKASIPLVGLFGGQGMYLETSSNFQFKNVIYHKMKWYYRVTDAQQTLLDDYKGIINSLCLFITPPQSLYLMDTEITYYNDDGTKEYPPRNLRLQYMDQNETGYYKIHEVPLLNVIEGANDASVYPEIGGIDLLPTRIALPMDDGSHHSLMARNAFLYNQRNHYGNIRTKLADSMNPEYFATEGGGDPTITVIRGYTGYSPQANTGGWELTVLTYLQLSEGERVVSSKFTQAADQITVWEHSSNPDLLFLGPVIGYPDIRAYKIVLWLYNSISHKYYEFLYIPLTPNQFHNFASNVTFDDTSEQENIIPYVIDLSAAGSPPGTERLAADYNAAIAPVNNYYEDSNRLQLTGIGNPFTFPSQNSYRVGAHGNQVLKAISMGEAISQGQFGQFPLYVFSSAGIWTLEVGSGEVVYKSIHPLNSDVVSNINSIVNVGHGVTYATTRGLFLITGSQIQEISATVEGRLDNPIRDFSDYKGFINTDVFVELEDMISARTFLQTLQNARIGYDRKNRELIVSWWDYDASRAGGWVNRWSGSGASRHWNTISTEPFGSGSGSISTRKDDATKDGYSYVYSFITGEWYKISQQFGRFFDSYPDFLAVTGNSMYNLSVEKEGENRSVLIQTRPITLAQFGFKKILRVNIYGWFEPVVDTFPALYVYGSQNGKKWHLLQGQQVPYLQNYTVISLQRTEGWCRYFIFLFTAQVSPDSVIEGMQVEYDERYTNRLRG